jgi:very-short-patch-repair endonuclease
MMRRQHGLATVEQLRALGVSRQMMRTRLASGLWVKADATVIRLAAMPVSWEGEVLARVLAAGPGAVASHRTAGALWNLDGRRRGIPEIAIPRGRTYRRAGVRVHESRDLHLITSTLRSGIPTTPVARTILDLCAVVPVEDIQLAVDSARRQRVTDWAELLDTLARHARPGRPGVRVLRHHLDQHFREEAVTDSAFERLVMVLLATAGLPRPVLHHVVRSERATYEIDLAYPDRMLAIELDGGVHLERSVWEKDHARQNALILAGWRLLRFTWRDYAREPTRIIREVRTALHASDSPVAVSM